MVIAHWQIGRLIDEHKQQGEYRTTYGMQLLKGLSKKLTAEFGKGFDISKLRKPKYWIFHQDTFWQIGSV